MTNPLALVPPKVRVVLYLIYAIGSVVATYLIAKEVIGLEEAALWAGIGTVLGLTAASNTTGQVVQGEVLTPAKDEVLYQSPAVDELGFQDEYQGKHERTPEV